MNTCILLIAVSELYRGAMAAPILIGTDSFICVVVVIYNLIEKRLYLHETFLTEKIPEIAASSLFVSAILRHHNPWVYQ